MMSGKIHYLHGRPTEISNYLRLGSSGYKQLEELHTQNLLGSRRFVVDAANYDKQAEVIGHFQQDGAEIVLDTNIAELSCVGRYQGGVRNLPWANQERPLIPNDFSASSKWQLIEKIAEYAVDKGVHRILAPTHLVEGIDDWFLQDLKSVERFRKVLDSFGGKNIAIDYALLMSNKNFNDRLVQNSVVTNMADLPFDNLWCRISGFGGDASPNQIRRYISALFAFHNMGKPLVVENVGGLAALAILAFGGSAAISHGLAEKERFNANAWNKEPQKRGRGGSPKRLYIPAIDRYVTLSQAETIFSAKGAIRHLACSDLNCCPKGLSDSLKDPKRHFIIQRAKQLAELSGVSDKMRPQHFLTEHLQPAERLSRRAAKLKTGDDATQKILSKASQRLDKFLVTIEDLSKRPENTRTPLIPKTYMLSDHYLGSYKK